MGDYGAEDYYVYKKQDVKDGMFLVLVNSLKGEYYFQQIVDSMFYQQKALDMVLLVQQNIARSNELHPLRQKFFAEYKEKDFNKIRKKYLMAPMKDKFIHKFGVERYRKIKRVLRKTR